MFESYTFDPLCQAVESAWKAGIVVVVSAGNSGRDNSACTPGYGTIDAQANDPLALTVGAMKTEATASPSDDAVASYSSKGPALLDHIVKPDLVAPGNRIFAILDANGSLNTANSGNIVPVSAYEASPYRSLTTNYFMLSGASMAAAVVSGASAILLAIDPTLTPDMVKARLMKTAIKAFPTSSQVTVTDPVTNRQTIYTGQYDLFTIGAGYLNVPAALSNSDRPASGRTAQSPQASFDSASGNIYVVNGTSTVWGGSAVWGSSAVWGGSANAGAESSDIAINL